jgi:hypothetical protein
VVLFPALFHSIPFYSTLFHSFQNGIRARPPEKDKPKKKDKDDFTPINIPYTKKNQLVVSRMMGQQNRTELKPGQNPDDTSSDAPAIAPRAINYEDYPKEHETENSRFYYNSSNNVSAHGSNSHLNEDDEDEEVLDQKEISKVLGIEPKSGPDTRFEEHRKEAEAQRLSQRLSSQKSMRDPSERTTSVRDLNPHATLKALRSSRAMSASRDSILDYVGMGAGQPRADSGVSSASSLSRNTSFVVGQSLPHSDRSATAAALNAAVRAEHDAQSTTSFTDSFGPHSALQRLRSSKALRSSHNNVLDYVMGGYSRDRSEHATSGDSSRPVSTTANATSDTLHAEGGDT